MQHNHQPLYGTNLRPGLAEGLRCNPGSIHFLNDTAAFLIGELEPGAAVGSRRCVGVTLGTGVVSAFAIRQDIVNSGAGVPGGGEIWNLPYRTGIVEHVLSSNGMVREKREYAGSAGTATRVRDIAESAREQPEAGQVFEHFGRRLGRSPAPHLRRIRSGTSRAGGRDFAICLALFGLCPRGVARAWHPPVGFQFVRARSPMGRGNELAQEVLAGKSRRRRREERFAELIPEAGSAKT